ncbi:Pentapeptide repeats (8 copies) [compost metagenome]
MACQRLKPLPKKDVAALRERWTPDLVPELANPRRKNDWRDKTLVNRHWAPSPFGLTADGRLDYRGFPHRVPHYQNLQSVDLSYLQPQHGRAFLLNAIMTDCDFTGAALGAIEESFVRCRFDLVAFNRNVLSGVFQACSFVQAKLLECSSMATFTECDFRDADFSGTDVSRARFVRCNFDGANWKGAQLHKATFVGCRPNDEQLAACHSNEGIRFEDDSGQQVDVTVPQAAEDPLLAWGDRLTERLAKRPANRS